MLNFLRLLLLMTVFLPNLLFAQQEIDATIEGGVVRPIPLAIPQFTDETGNLGDISLEMRDVIANDLRSTGLFRDLPLESFLSDNGDFDGPIDFASGTGIGAEAYIRGAVANVDGENMSVKFRLYDVIAGQEMGNGMKFEGPVDQWRRMAHKVSDLVYEALTGEGAYFDTKIVFVDETGPKEDRVKRLAVMDSDGANLQYLTDGSAIVLAPRWAGNTRDIIYTSYETGVPMVVLMNTETGEKFPYSELPGLAYSPRLSPDASKLLLSLIDDFGNSDLYIIDIASGQRERLTREPSIETSPTWSPDGTQIAFESDQSGEQQIYVMNLASKEVYQVSQGEGSYASPVWSPKGDLVAFTKVEGGQFHIGVMNIDGSEERLLTSAFIDEGATWAPNGRVLMFYRETAGEGGAPILHSISLTGRNLVEIETPEFASDPSWSVPLP